MSGYCGKYGGGTEASPQGGPSAVLLVPTAGTRWIVDPVENYEWQAANHEDDSHDQENSSLGCETRTK